MRLFSKSIVNSGRQTEADFAKAVCLIGMVFVHVFEEIPLYFINGSLEESTTAYVLVIVLDAIFGAATFMFCMGFGVTFTKKAEDPSYLIRRGIKLLICGYIFNIVRLVIPEIIRDLSRHETETLLTDLLSMFMLLDIFQFAGLALLLLGLLKKWRLSDRSIVFTALGMSIAGSFVRDFPIADMLGIEKPVPAIVTTLTTGLFAGSVFGFDPTLESSPFPLLNWFIFVVAGYLFAKMLRHCENKKRFYTIASCSGGALVILYMLIAIPNRIGMMSGNINQYYHLTTPEALLCIIASISVFGMYYGLSNILPKAVSKAAGVISHNLTYTYVIHWVLIEWSLTVIAILSFCFGKDPDTVNVTVGQAILFALIILTAALTLAILYRNHKENKRVK